jgi:hypothetical protein
MRPNGNGGMTQRFWTDSEVVQLRALAKTHTTWEAAAALGRTRTSVEGKAQVLGISFRKYGDAHHSTRHPTAAVLQVFTWREQGLSTREIAQRLGTSPCYVRMIARREVRWRETLPHLLAASEAST